jgi:hypothetical protein
MGLVDLPEIEDYFLGDFCVRLVVGKAMTLKRFQRLGQYIHLNDEEKRPDQKIADFDILYKERPALDLMDKFTQAYTPGCELAVEEAMIGFKGRFCEKQYLPGKPTKWGMKACGLAVSASSYLLKCDIYKGKKKFDNKTFYYGNKLYYNLQTMSGKNGIIFISTIFSAPQIL